jgi:hypothetical protein
VDFLRQGRYVVPPFVLLITVVVGFWLEGVITRAVIQDLKPHEVALLIAAVGAATSLLGSSSEA